MCGIVSETCDVLWRKLQPLHMTTPTTDQWKRIATDFWNIWNFPNCIGAIDGKHTYITIASPNKSGSLFYNYKGTFSIVLMAMCDANNKFIFVDVGSYGSNSDGGVLANSNFYNLMDSNSLGIPKDQDLPGAARLGKLPFVAIGDEAFPLKRSLLRPYPGAALNDPEKAIYNYRLSRARRIIECAFGILVHRWRVLLTRSHLSPDKAVKVVKACCVLHNYLSDHIYGHARNDLPRQAQPNEIGASNDEDGGGIAVRDKFKQFFTNDGRVAWQDDAVRRGQY